MKFIFVTGGVVSSLGKGLAAAALGTLLENRGLKVVLQKFDPYLNVDPGTMNPFQHGEVYVLNDGAETDLDLGHYERFTNCVLTRHNSLTSGQVYETVIARERRGDYLGKTVQVIPHVTNEIKDRIRLIEREQPADVLITEIGGTTGDIEGLPFLEAIRQFILEVGPRNAIVMHVTLVPFIKAAGELKTKPSQQSVAKLREIGLQPQVLICRCEQVHRRRHPRQALDVLQRAGQRGGRDARRAAHDLRGPAAAPGRGAGHDGLRPARPENPGGGHGAMAEVRQPGRVPEKDGQNRAGRQISNGNCAIHSGCFQKSSRLVTSAPFSSDSVRVTSHAAAKVTKPWIG